MAQRNSRYEWHNPLCATDFLKNQIPSTPSTDDAQVPNTPILEQGMCPARSAPLSPLHRSPTPQVREWSPYSLAWSAPVPLDSQDTPQASPPNPPTTHVLKSYRSYGPVPATPSRHAVPATPDGDDLEIDTLILGYSSTPPSGVFTYDPSGPAPRTPLWMPAPDPDGFSLDGSRFVLGSGGDAYPSPPRTPKHNAYR